MAAELRTEPSQAPGHVTAPEAASAVRRGRRTNRGAELDRLARALPAGAALEFVRGLPRRTTKEELLADLEALVRLLQQAEGGRR